MGVLTMTIRELRQMLTAADNQGMTIKELRALLFEIDGQDEIITENDMLRLTYGK